MFLLRLPVFARASPRAATARLLSTSATQRPLIGVTTSTNVMEYELQSQPVAMLPGSYASCVSDAGGQPLLLPEGVPEQAAELISRLDALVLSGGRDIDPALYGQAAHAETTDVRRAQDEWEAALLDAALQVDLPLLAICRGFQLLCVRRGGSLYQHLPDAAPHADWDAHLGWRDHRVEVYEETRLSALLGPGGHTVRVANHQGVADPGDLRPAGVSSAETGALLMAAEAPAACFCVGVQWHPEQLSGKQALFEGLVATALARQGVERQ